MTKNKEEVIEGEVIVETRDATQAVITMTSGISHQILVDPTRYGEALNSPASMVTFSCLDGILLSIAPMNVARIEAKKVTLRIEPEQAVGG
tara:strand:+ start:1732 stop:2004 length:273 start_codon:yes stop_codon:yes gene_type:complete